MKRTKRLLATVMATAMVVGAALTANAASLSKICPACGQSNASRSVAIGFCRACDTDDDPGTHVSCNIYTYVCSRCGVLYKVCGSGHYQ